MSWRKAIRFLNQFISLCIITLLIATIFLVISSRASGQQASIFGYQIKTVLSGSMEPDIQTGSIIAVKTGGDMTRFKKGDIITFYMEKDLLVTHRIQKVLNGGQKYVTKGDANNTKDREPVLQENIVGQYTGITIPYIGYLMNFATTKEGIALVFIFPGFLLLGYAFLVIRRAFRQLEQRYPSMDSTAIKNK